MSAHRHTEFVPGCFRCDLSRVESDTPTTTAANVTQGHLCTCGGIHIPEPEPRQDGRCECGSLMLTDTLSDRHDRGLHSATRCTVSAWLRFPDWNTDRE